MAFLGAVADVERAASRLRDDRDRVARHVETLLDGGWRGVAATAYGEGWLEWREGADQVLAGLEAMARLLRGVEASFTETDRGALASVTRIADRLG